MIAWVDAGAGVSGDMLLGALVDAGAPVEQIQAQLDRMGLPITLRSTEVFRAGMRATKVDVEVPSEHHQHRHLPDVMAHLSDLDEPIREKAAAVFQRLAEAEARAHGIPVDHVHFHEVGALDSIADVVGVVTAFHLLGSPEVHSSPIAVGSGRVRTDHGSIPVPVPAVVELLKGLPLLSGPAEFESATPTGAAILATLATGWGSIPAMSLQATGIGAGSTDPDGHPNVVRVVLGDLSSHGSTSVPVGPWQLETNVDDMDPRLWPSVQQRLIDAGASDAWITPIVMKKGRPATMLSVLCRDEVLEPVRATIYRETSTIGIRQLQISKHSLDRAHDVVRVGGHEISTKIASLGGVPVNVSVEWEDVVLVASHLGRSVKEVLDEAKALAIVQMRPGNDA